MIDETRFVRALTNAIPSSCRKICALGSQAETTQSLTLETRENFEVTRSELADCVLFTDPIHHDPATHGELHRQIHELSNRPWIVLHGTNEFSPSGFAIVLQRCSLRVDEVFALNADGERLPEIGSDYAAFVAIAKFDTYVNGPYAKRIAETRKQSRERCAEGETLFACGEVIEAARRFAQASTADLRDAVPQNDLATAMHALGRPHDAYQHALAALHRDPTLESARENLRVIAQEIGRSAEADRTLALWGIE